MLLYSSSHYHPHLPLITSPLPHYYPFLFTHPLTFPIRNFLSFLCYCILYLIIPPLPQSTPSLLPDVEPSPLALCLLLPLLFLCYFSSLLLLPHFSPSPCVLLPLLFLNLLTLLFLALLPLFISH